MIKIKKGSPDWFMFGEISPKLGIVFYEFVLLMKRRGIDNLVITSIKRKKENDSGVHAVGRAIDISLTGVPKNIAQEVAEIINALYPYGSGKQSVILHTGVGYGGDNAEHIHIQSNE